MSAYRLTEETVLRIYAGWLGKIIGIRLGAPVESWTAEKIAEVYGETWNYPVDYGTFAADDDSNGPVFFVRALRDGGRGAGMTAQDVADALLNYAPCEHGFFWWGGYGVSTEHTAYLNLRNGIAAPISGSILKNGTTIAEQIGGQIFIDPWGLVAPGNPGLAARLAREAASVTHDGNGVYGGIFIACCISLAFTDCSVREMVEGALAFIPADSEYARVVRSVLAYSEEDAGRDWRAAFQYVKENFGYDKYEGWCHIIPNAAVIVLALLYGEDDFTKTLCIANMCGWDTDCNVGNLGAIMGVRRGTEGIEYDRWRAPINDLLLCSGVLGELNIQDIPYGALYMAECAFALAGEGLSAKWAALRTDDGVERVHFEFPGSTHAMRVRCEGNGDTPGLEAHVRNVGVDGASETWAREADGGVTAGTRCLRMHAYPLHPGQDVFLYQKTYYRPKELHDDRYEPAFSPKIYPGQTVRAAVRVPEGTKAVRACLYVRDLHGGATGARIATGPAAVCEPGVWTELAFAIPEMEGALLDEVGVRFTVPGGSGGLQDFSAYLGYLEYGGEPDYSVDFSQEELLELPMSHYEVTQFTKLKGWTYLENNCLHLSSEDFGETYTGSRLFRDYELTAEIIPVFGDAHFINVRVQGGQRSYAAGFDGEGRLVICKNKGAGAHGGHAPAGENATRTRDGDNYQVLAETAFSWAPGEAQRLTVRVEGPAISIFDGEGRLLLSATDEERPYLTGATGFSVRRGGHLAVRAMALRPI